MNQEEKTFVYRKNPIISIIGSVFLIFATYSFCIGAYNLVVYFECDWLIIGACCLLISLPLAFVGDSCYMLKKQDKYIYYTDLYKVAENEEVMQEGKEYMSVAGQSEFEPNLSTGKLVFDTQDESAVVLTDRYHFQKCVIFEGMKDCDNDQSLDYALVLKARHHDKNTGISIIEFLEEV